jgi:hypothetical protein
LPIAPTSTGITTVSVVGGVVFGVEVLEPADLVAAHPAGDRVQSFLVGLGTRLAVAPQQRVGLEPDVLALKRQVAVVRDRQLDPAQPREQRVADEVEALLLDGAVRERVTGRRPEHVRRDPENPGDLLCRQPALLDKLAVVELGGGFLVLDVALDYQQAVWA